MLYFINHYSVSGLYNNAYLMAHDCVSNTHQSYTDDFRTIVRAAVPIKKGDMITTIYALTLDGTLQRQEFIRDSKFFNCDCSRCKDPTELGTYLSAVKCTKCPNGYLLSQNPLVYYSAWNCCNCSNSMSAAIIQELNTTFLRELDTVEAHVNDSSILQLESLLQKYSGTVLHPNHCLLIKIIHSLSQLYGRTQSIEDLDFDVLRRKKTLCEQLLKVLDIIEPGLSRIRGTSPRKCHIPPLASISISTSIYVLKTW
jgi:hypothetical protein